jgi:hypothetical protein
MQISEAKVALKTKKKKRKLRTYSSADENK